MKLFALALTLLTSLAVAGWQQLPEYTVASTWVKDGDTVHVFVATWPGQTSDSAIRVNGINTPELRAKRKCERRDAVAALTFAEHWFSQDNVKMRLIKYDKFGGRLVGEFFHNGSSYADEVLKRGLAVPFNGRTKKPVWECLPVR